MSGIRKKSKASCINILAKSLPAPGTQGLVCVFRGSLNAPPRAFATGCLQAFRCGV